MDDSFEKDNALTVMWLVSKVKNESTNQQDPSRVCKLNDYSEFEMYQFRQAVDSEDRI
ncbi:MAG: hypothetical protein K2X81_04115 [Candidatus Obscuribacterales bacterium]|nr:hypothetical protein [Candidatus Obscuribacterales bacterium]